MKWSYYYQLLRPTEYNHPLWTISTKIILHWIKTYEALLRGYPEQRTAQYQRNKIWYCAPKWIRLFHAEIERRRIPEYRQYINDILHGIDKTTPAHALADYLMDDLNKPVLSRKVRRWVIKLENPKALTESI